MWLSTVKVRLAIGQLSREPTFRPLDYATLTRDYAILPMLGRPYWPMLAMLSLPYTGYAHAILCLLESEYASMKHQHSKA